MNKLNFLFVVQGEGRGHMTQAMALYDLLTKEGHEVACVAVGSTSLCEVPEFFRSRFNCPVVALQSPRFSKDREGRSISMVRTVLRTLKDLPQYLHSITVIRRLVAYHRPDMILNFYDPLVGLYAITSRHRPRIVSMAHQYIFLHPSFRFPAGRKWERLMIRNYTAMTALGSDLRLAISLYDLPGPKVPGMELVPPILRAEVLHHDVETKDHILVYLVNAGYMQEIMDWHARHPEVKLHAFTDSTKVREQHDGCWQVDETLSFHSLHGPLFLEYLSSCRALASTAGFETVAEAMYLEKPVLMVPVEGHFEQFCNARDAHRSGAGVYSDKFNLTKLLDHVLFHQPKQHEYKSWVNSCDRRILDALNQLVNTRRVLGTFNLAEGKTAMKKGQFA